MTVKEVVMLAAEELGISAEIKEYYEEGVTAGKMKADRLLTCFNLVENELALDYFSLKKSEIIASNGQITFSSLKNSPVNIISVTDAENNPYEFALYANYIQTVSGAVKVTYSYTPNMKTIDDESDFSGEISARLMSYGIAAEYSLEVGAFEDAAVWDKKYKDAISVWYKRSKGGRMPSRRWA